MIHFRAYGFIHVSGLVVLSTHQDISRPDPPLPTYDQSTWHLQHQLNPDLGYRCFPCIQQKQYALYTLIRIKRHMLQEIRECHPPSALTPLPTLPVSKTSTIPSPAAWPSTHSHSTPQKSFHRSPYNPPPSNRSLNQFSGASPHFVLSSISRSQSTAPSASFRYRPWPGTAMRKSDAPEDDTDKPVRVGAPPPPPARWIAFWPPTADTVPEAKRDT